MKVSKLSEARDRRSFTSRTRKARRVAEICRKAGTGPANTNRVPVAAEGKTSGRPNPRNGSTKRGLHLALCKDEVEKREGDISPVRGPRRETHRSRGNNPPRRNDARRAPCTRHLG